ncbi:hypothetical protein KDA_47680 [Dictyobacter alpinus]|uniref:Uncharacterized protein n=1 Tax=Dictyobacter alpinus TaxID=2014873 RepID=A0A402BD68_9CHLR|nr:class II fructose-bisphosphate aldolase [Dictyobacter alpinus]GCE29284.1 hypothetical protein KDA_47680 [Dictyobacter alpinus]
MARAFVEATSASMLAVAIGNVHGFTPNPPPLDFELLSQIASQVRMWILHNSRKNRSGRTAYPMLVIE